MFRMTPISRRLFLGATAATAARAKRKAYTFEPADDGMTLKAPDGNIVFSYLTRKPAGVPLAGNNACCFHPVNTLSGERVTDIAPSDHRDHRGMFFAWQSMDFQRKNGLLRGDFWGWGHFAPTKGRVIVNRDLRLVKADSHSAVVAVRNDWTIDGEKVMDEATTAHAHEDGHSRIMDMQFRVTSDGDMTINQVAFTGFMVRCRKDGQGLFCDKNGKVTYPDSDPLKPESDWPPADWYSYTITTEGGKTVSAAVVDHPSNPRSPWHSPRKLCMLDPCISATGPVHVPANKPLTLRYRAIFADGELSADYLNKLSSEFRSKQA